MRKLIPVIAIALFCIHMSCRIRHEGPDAASQNQIIWGIYSILANQGVTTLQDNNDGTVSVITNYPFTGYQRRWFLKKCLQGQVYQAATNDCHGVGTAANHYGAALLQYCSQNNFSCNGGGSRGLDGSGNSEAYLSCSADATVGRAWRVNYGTHSVAGRGNLDTTTQQFQLLYPDITSFDQVWTTMPSPISAFSQAT